MCGDIIIASQESRTGWLVHGTIALSENVCFTYSHIPNTLVYGTIYKVTYIPKLGNVHTIAMGYFSYVRNTDNTTLETISLM